MAPETVITTENQVYRDPASFEHLTAAELEVLRIVQESNDAWSRQDVDAIASFYAPDAVYWEVGSEPSVGPGGVRNFAEEWLAICPDFTVFAERIAVTGDTGILMGVATGEVKGGIETAPGKYSKAGKLELWFIQSITVKDGNIVYQRDQLDTRYLDEILGLAE